jgi:hypothetical protein
MRSRLTVCLLALSVIQCAAWIALPPRTRGPSLRPLRMGLFDNIRNPLDRASSIFEESTTLGKGVTYAKIQVALNSPNRGPGSILGLLASKADDADTSSALGLAKLVSEVR